MTYCVGMLVEDGLVMMADTLTNAGVDNISTYRKLHVLSESRNRIVVAMTAGNLSVTQSAITMIEEGLPPREEGAMPRRISDMPTLFRAAQLVGEAIYSARREIDTTVRAEGISTGVSILLGGRIGNEPLKLYMIYSQGNFIECHSETPFLQIGSMEYGKPILDRALHYETTLSETVKIGLLSFDSTMRSNLAVGRPIDLIVIPEDPALPVTRRRIESDDDYFNMISIQWGGLLRDALDAIPDPPFLSQI